MAGSTNTSASNPSSANALRCSSSSSSPNATALLSSSSSSPNKAAVAPRQVKFWSRRQSESTTACV